MSELSAASNALHLAVWGQIVMGTIVLIALDLLAGLSIPSLIRTLTGEFKDLFSRDVTVGAINAATLLLLAAIILAVVVIPSVGEMVNTISNVDVAHAEAPDHVPYYVSLSLTALFGIGSVIAAKVK